ncbi:6541_t:CDS:1, partial [Ambispora gerdemannii]
NQHYEWKKEYKKAFQNLKEKLIDAPVLLYPDYKKKFILVTNTLKLGLGAILLQLNSEEKK